MKICMEVEYNQLYQNISIFGTNLFFSNKSVCMKSTNFYNFFHISFEIIDFVYKIYFITSLEFCLISLS